jgi:hypothetical protein
VEAEKIKIKIFFVGFLRTQGLRPGQQECRPFGARGSEQMEKNKIKNVFRWIPSNPGLTPWATGVSPLRGSGQRADGKKQNQKCFSVDPFDPRAYALGNRNVAPSGLEVALDAGLSSQG